MWKAECGMTHRGELRANLGSPVQGELARLLAFNGATEGLYRRPVTAFTLIFLSPCTKFPLRFCAFRRIFKRGVTLLRFSGLYIYMKAFFELEI